jgi:hypothetical protein
MNVWTFGSQSTPTPNPTTPGERVGTLALNTSRHMEIYYAVSGGCWYFGGRREEGRGASTLRFGVSMQVLGGR